MSELADAPAMIQYTEAEPWLPTLDEAREFCEDFAWAIQQRPIMDYPVDEEIAKKNDDWLANLVQEMEWPPK